MPDTKLPLTPRALLELKIPHDPHLSPDGRRVVFAVAEADFEESRWVSRLWLADLEEGRAHPVTFSYEGERAPRWSPDGRRIAFLSTRPDMTEPPPEDEHEEEERAQREQVWVMPTDGGEAQKLTAAKEGVRAFAWAPDGRTLLFLAPEARPRPAQFARDDARKRKIDPVVEHDDRLRMQFWEVGVEDRKADLLYTGDFGIVEFDVSPDGKRLVYGSNRTGDPNDYYEYDLYVLELDRDDAPRRLVERAGGKFQPRWSPDGMQVAFLANRDPALSYSQECVFVVPAEGGAPANLFEGAPWDALHLLWGRGGALHAVVADRTRGPLLRWDGAAWQPVTAPGATVECLDYDAAGGAVVAVLEDDRTPPELYALGPGGERRALTELNREFAERYALPRQEVIRWQSDGMEIEGVLVYPPDEGVRSEPLPLVVMVHGGPKGRAVNTLRSYHLHPAWAVEGYLVLKPNFRGSEGYGDAFATATRRDLGGGDFRDIMAGVDALVERGLADPQRMGIMGGSYGGYMTNWAIGQTDRFAAAVSMFGIFNLVTDYSNSEISRWDRDYLGAFYWEDPEIYRRCSPASHLERIRTPVLIIHGESDNNTFLSNSKEMYRALRERGAAVQFVHYPREGHGLREPNHRLDEMRRCLGWMDRYLKGAGDGPPARRVGDRIEHEDWELHVLRAEDGDYAGRHEEDPRLLEVAFTLASREPVEQGWTFPVDEVRLVGPDGAEIPPGGVPVDAGGARMLVEGREMALTAHPDRDTGRLSLALAVAFAIPREGGAFTLRVADFPPVAFAVGPKEAQDEEEDGESARKGERERSDPAPPTGEEGPAETPQRTEGVNR